MRGTAMSVEAPGRKLHPDPSMAAEFDFEVERHNAEVLAAHEDGVGPGADAARRDDHDGT